MLERLRAITDTLAWNLFLLILGSFVYVLGYNAIAIHHQFVPGALYGLSVVVHKMVPDLSLPQWYLLLNIPLFILAWKGVSRRFFFLNLFCMLSVTALTAFVHCDFGIKTDVYSAIAAGAFMGAGSGIILRTYGGGGGLDVLAVILNRKYGTRIGMFYFVVNAGVVLFALRSYSADIIVASLVMQFISSVVTEYVLSLFNQRKAVRILTQKGDDLLQKLVQGRRVHATIFPGKGGYTGKQVDMIFSITNNLHMRALEQAILDVDPNAIIVVENTFSVLGGTVFRRKTY